jgi:hypothetical protein
MKQITDMAVDGESIPEKVAIVSPSSRYKGFITRARFEGGGFLVISCKGMTNGDTWDSIGRSQSLAECINKLRSANFCVYEFDTVAELGRWMAE